MGARGPTRSTHRPATGMTTSSPMAYAANSAPAAPGEPSTAGSTGTSGTRLP